MLRRAKPRWATRPKILLAALSLILVIGGVAGPRWLLSAASAFLDNTTLGASNLDELEDFVRQQNAPTDELGRLVLDGIQFPTPAPMREDMRLRVRTLSEQYRERIAVVPRGFFPTEVREPDLANGAPPRMDSGDPDPDRLNGPPQLAGMP